MAGNWTLNKLRLDDGGRFSPTCGVCVSVRSSLDAGGVLSLTITLLIPGSVSQASYVG
jgi:hypothetical protein